eukprot:TRINITY_DN695_c0_g1_i1.p1 TRINITY_DN695_c0_g1~~TRINITY_DN695_c0_g1_i1.p1  ORF type:complete len:283 (-),score=47.04 TRINITY_DN695_c0_g1_i1:116-934(-)
MAMRGVLPLFGFLLVFVAGVASVENWPGTDATSLSGDLPAGFEVSGLEYIPSQNAIATISDNGKLAFVSISGELLFFRDYGSTVFDFEGLAISDDSLFLAIEYPPSIVQVDFGGDIKKIFNLSMPVTAKHGLEGLFYFPLDSTSGYLYCGSQADGKIYIFQFNSTVTASMMLHPAVILDLTPFTDLSGFAYDKRRSTLWVLFDTQNLAFTYRNTSALTHDPQTNNNWQAVVTYDVPGKGQEGITTALHDKYIVLGEDRSKESKAIVRYTLDL